MSKHVTTTQLNTVAQDIATKADSRFRKAADSYTKDQVDEKVNGAVAAAYRPAGSIAGASLTAALLIEGNFGNVYNVTTKLEITAENEALFKDRVAGDMIFVGENVGIVEAGTYSAASGTAAIGTSYYTRSGEEGSYVYAKADVQMGGDVSGLFTKDYIFDVLAAFVNYTAGNAIDITNRGINVQLGSNSNGLSVENGLQLSTATGSSTSYVQASGTYVQGTKYYTDSTGAEEVDTTGFEEGVTDVSGYFVAQVISGSAGAMSASDKAKLDSFEEASAADIAAITNGIWA